MSRTVQPVSGRLSTRIQGKPPGRRSSRSWTRERTFARAEVIFASWTGPIPSKVRYKVEAEAGCPSTSTACRITSMPAIERAPSSTAHAALTSTPPRSWTGRKSWRTSAEDSASLSPTLSARRRTGTIPALPTSFRPPTDSDRPSAHSVSFDTRRVPPPRHDPVLEKLNHHRSRHPSPIQLTLCHQHRAAHEFMRPVKGGAARPPRASGRR